MKKEGFTLIELLAVIVILGIIMLIATPTILNIVDDARKGAFKNSALGIIKAAETEYITNKLKLQEKSENLIFEYADGKIVGETDLNYKGSRPKSGKVIVTQNGRIALAITNETWCAKKDYNSNDLILEKMDENNCKILFTCRNDLVDERDNKVYKTTKIGDQCWFAENIKYTGNGCLSKTWDSSDTGPADACKAEDDEIHYQFNAGSCPSGWHIPTDEEWKILEGIVDSTYSVGDSVWDNVGYRGSDAGKKLKAVDAGGTDDYGFTGLLVGGRSTDGTPGSVGSGMRWWTSSTSGTNVWRRAVGSSYDAVSRQDVSPAYGMSVRCVLD